jgi:hypothetical protein
MDKFHQVTRQVCQVAEAKRPPFAWYAAFVVSLSLVGILGVCVNYLIFTGVGVWGLNNPVMWAFDITNFVFWVGIGHAGTLISAILFLFRQKWRHLRRSLPRHPRGPRLAGLLALPDSQPDGDVAAVPQPAALGRVRGEHLFQRLAALLVRGPDPRPGHAA